MKSITAYIILFSLLLSLGSCFKEDDPVEPHSIGGSQQGGAVLGSSYIHQVYYDLYTNQFVRTNHMEDWDLAFDAADDQWHIHINTARNMKVAHTGTTDFASVTSTAGLTFTFDKANGNPDSTAFGKWYTLNGSTPVSNQEIYVVDKGQNANFTPMGYGKVSIEALADGYKLRYAKLDGSNEQTFTIQKSAAHNRVFLNLSTGQVDIEPPKEDWTLHFTRYTTKVVNSLGVAEDYQVVGVLLNRYQCSAALDTVTNFADISLNDTTNFAFSNALDKIGYEWKYYDFTNAIYTIVPGQTFIIKDHRGLFYKLRFTDFYSNTGEKGSPQFEFVRL